MMAEQSTLICPQTYQLNNKHAILACKPRKSFTSACRAAANLDTSSARGRSSACGIGAAKCTVYRAMPQTCQCQRKVKRKRPMAARVYTYMCGGLRDQAIMAAYRQILLCNKSLALVDRSRWSVLNKDMLSSSRRTLLNVARHQLLLVQDGVSTRVYSAGFASR